MNTLRDGLIKKAHNCGWEQMPGTGMQFYNVVLFRYLGDGRREFLDLRFKPASGRLTAVCWRHPVYDKSRKITQRKVDHVHALLRAPRRDMAVREIVTLVNLDEQ